MSIDVSFTDASRPGPSGPITGWAWNFGDTGTSAVQNPLHTYAAAGLYTVQLTVTGTSPDGTSNITKSVQVGATGGLQATYTKSATGLAVTFTDTSVAGPSGPITGWAWNFGDGSTSTSQNPSHTYAAAGNYSTTLVVTGTGGDGTSTTSTTVSVSSGSPGFLSLTSWARPSFTPTRTIAFTTRSGLDAAIAGMAAGDLIKYTGTGVLTISSSSGLAYAIRGKNPTGIGAVIDFGTAKSIWAPGNASGNYVKFDQTGPRTSQWQTFQVYNCSNLNIYGGEITASNAAAGGLDFWGPVHDLIWYDFYVNYIGGSGVGVAPTSPSTGASSTVYNMTLRGEVNRFAMSPSLDAHLAKGCGIQGCILHGAAAGGVVHDTTYAIYAHDSLLPGEVVQGITYPEGGGGSAIEPGDLAGSNHNNTYYALAERLKMGPGNNGGALNPGSRVNGETGGNAIQFWGPLPLNGNVVGWVEANDCSGGCTHGTSQTGWRSGSPAITVSHGRHNNCNQYYAPSYSSNLNVPYDTHYSIVYNDCT